MPANSSIGSKDAASENRPRKLPYITGMLTATGGCGLSLIEPAIRGFKLWLIFIVASIAIGTCILKLRHAALGRGWIVPQSYSVMLAATVTEVWLYLWFSH